MGILRRLTQREIEIMESTLLEILSSPSKWGDPDLQGVRVKS